MSDDDLKICETAVATDWNNLSAADGWTPLGMEEMALAAFLCSKRFPVWAIIERIDLIRREEQLIAEMAKENIPMDREPMKEALTKIREGFSLKDAIEFLKNKHNPPEKNVVLAVRKIFNPDLDEQAANLDRNKG